MYPYLDGELGAQESLRIQEHLDLCPSCCEIFVAERWIHAVPEPTVAPVPAPDSLRRQIVSAMSEQTGGRRRWLPSVKLVAVPGVLGVIAVIAWLLALPPSQQAPELLRLAVVEHEHYTRSPEDLRITGHDTATVAAQLERDLPFRLGLPPGTVEGVTLSGGAVLTMDHTKVALLMYRVNETPVSLLLTTPQEIVAPVQEIVTFKNIVFHSGSLDGHHTLQWSDRRFTYVLVSDDQHATHQACVICHNSPQGRNTIAGFFQGI